MNEPVISIITSSLNSEAYLENTILSIIKQTYRKFEYIIIDGGSTDRTLDIIKKYESDIDFWSSEPDEGIADAMNKGLKKASGNYVLFIHSDDYLIDNHSLARAVSYLDNKHDIYTFQVLFEDNGNKTISLNRKLTWWTNFKMGSCHQGQICSRSMLKELGGFDKEFRINMDYDLILRAYRKGFKSVSINFPIAVMRLIGISSQKNWPGLRKRLEEERSIHKKNAQNIYMRIIYLFYWFFYMKYRRILIQLNGLKHSQVL